MFEFNKQNLFTRLVWKKNRNLILLYFTNLLRELLYGFVGYESQRLRNDKHQIKFAAIDRPGTFIHSQEVHFVLKVDIDISLYLWCLVTYRLKQHCRIFLVQHFGIQLQSILAKGEKFALIREQDSRRRLLVVAIIARIEHFDAWLLVALGHWQFWCDTVAISKQSKVSYGLLLIRNVVMLFTDGSAAWKVASIVLFRPWQSVHLKIQKA